MAEVVELGDGTLGLRHCNCPIQDVAARTGFPCANEQQMYERLLGAPVARTTWMAQAAHDCTYVMNSRGAGTASWTGPARKENGKKVG